MAKLPYIAFYPGDWRKDAGVQSLTLSARAFWFEILISMHERGTGEVKGSYETFARMVGGGCTADQAKAAIQELHDTGTADVRIIKREIFLTNRRMQRQCKEREMNRKYVQEHRLRQKSGDGKVPVSEVSDVQSYSCSYSITEEPSSIASSSYARPQTLTDQDWEQVAAEEQAKAPAKDAQESLRKYLATPGPKTIPGFRKWFAREWPKKVSPIRQGVNVGAPTKSEPIQITEEKIHELHALAEELAGMGLSAQAEAVRAGIPQSAAA
jgi:hypothetical protein